MVDTVPGSVPVSDGGVPVLSSFADDAVSKPGLVVVPSIFGGNEDLLAAMRSLADIASTIVFDPFWRGNGGAVPYADFDTAIARLDGLDRGAVFDDMVAVAEWMRPQTNGAIAGLGICFGGPLMLLGTSVGTFQGGVAWHGTRMEDVLDRCDGLIAPLRLHFGSIDPITPPDVIDAVATRFADHPDCRIVVHEGADHAFSHEGANWHPEAAAAGMADLRRLLVDLS